MPTIIPKQHYTTTHQGLFNQYLRFLMADVHNLRIEDDRKEELFDLLNRASVIIKDYPLK